MERVKIAITDSDNTAKLPSGWCLMAFMEGDEVLHLGISPNAGKRYAYLKERAKEDAGVDELLKTASSLQVEKVNSALDALIALKTGVHDARPRLQNSYRPWQNYVYLAIDAYHFPFIRITPDTNDDWIYLGPFRDRFFLADVLDCVGRILRLPRCESDVWPCDKLDRGLCGGYCRGLDSSFREPDTDAGLSNDPKASGESDYSLEKLDSLLKESFLSPSQGILEMLKHERDKYFDDLEFIKADLLDEEIALQQKYRDWLIFLYAARQLNWEDDRLLVERGRIRRCTYRGRDYLFAPDSTPYRENESLALNLDSVDEARILYEYYKDYSQG
ncbi:MAG TPA: hypothetical protein PKI63_03220 [Candidatus Cloacimonadota bacterium]|nr:hypothetical protein [Candidatus Cloacimonadota bacterium]HOH78966.1 hypothetical protein [Candidatus Cloacimonadota bacterium]